MVSIQQKNYFTVNSTSVDLNFTLHQAKLNILMGRNGIGKSTFFNHLKESKILNFSVAFMDQFPLCPISEYQVQDLFQIILEECNGVISQKEVELRYDLKIDDLLLKNINYLSGGEQQRVKLFCTLMLNREAVFLDEPFQYLDVESVKVFKNIFKNLIKENKTVLIIEHDKSLIEEFDSHFIHMREVRDKIEVINGD